MMNKLIDGKRIASNIRKKLADKIEFFKERYNKFPSLAIILVGDNPASKVYIKMKTKAADEIGIAHKEYFLPSSTTQQELTNLIRELNKDSTINGILVQLPLPSHIQENKVMQSIDPSKDVDGFHPINIGKLLMGEECFCPCTPYGIQQLLIQSGYKWEHKFVVILGRSNIVGKPLFSLLVQKKQYANATVSICHSATKDLKKITQMADILIAAIGRPLFVKKDMIKKGSIVIDVGINRIEKNGKSKIVGDVDFDDVIEKVEAITPVPGGVGPMTVASLMENTVKAFMVQNNICLGE